MLPLGNDTARLVEILLITHILSQRGEADRSAADEETGQACNHPAARDVNGPPQDGVRGGMHRCHVAQLGQFSRLKLTGDVGRVEPVDRLQPRENLRRRVGFSGFKLGQIGLFNLDLQCRLGLGPAAILPDALQVISEFHLAPRLALQIRHTSP